jgi:Flp pilus assembly protein TadG
MIKYNRRSHYGRGQSLVEVALVLPILLIIMMGLLDFGRAFYIQVALRDAADEGAVYAAIHPNDTTGIEQRVVYASTMLFTIDPATISVVLPANMVAGEPVTVIISHPLQLYTPFVQGLVSGGTLTINGQSTQPIITP